MGFCGEKINAFNIDDGVLNNECFVDGLNIIPHALFILCTVPMLVVWNKSTAGKTKVKTWVHYWGHDVRWMTSLVLFLTLVLQIAEGAMADYRDPDAINYHTFIPSCIAFVGAIFSIAFYHNIENCNLPRFLLGLICYWIFAIVVNSLKITSLYRNDVSIDILRIWLHWVATILYCLLLVIEVNLFRKQRYAFSKKPLYVHPAPALGNTRYIHAYANFLSKVTFWWMTDIIIAGYKKVLEIEDLGTLPQSEHAVVNCEKLVRCFEEEKLKASQKSRPPSFVKSYLKAFWPMLALAAVFRLLGDLLTFVGPMLIESIVDYAFATRDALKSHESGALKMDNMTVITSPYLKVSTFFSSGYTLSVLLFLAAVLQNTFLQNYHYLVIRQGIRLRAAAQSMVYEKALRLSSLVLSGSSMSVGKIINHMSVDSNALMFLFFFMHYVWAMPIQIIVAFIMLYMKLGTSAVIGALVVILALPIQFTVGRNMAKYQKKILENTDVRMKRCNELIQGMRVIKLFAWEKLFSSKVEEARRKELIAQFKHGCVRAMMEFIMAATPIAGIMVTFVIYPYMENEPLTAGKAFSTVALFNILSLPLFMTSMIMGMMISAGISSKRLVPYLVAAEAEGLKPLVDPKGHNSMTSNASQGHLVVKFDMENGAATSLLHKDDELSTSLTSLGSNFSKTTAHSRQNSSASLKEMVECKRMGMSRNASAGGLSLGDGSETRRIRHHSGMSTDEEEEGSADPSVVTEQHSAVEVSGGNFSWDLEESQLTLKDIDVKIPAGKLTMVIGPVGAGKSSLLSAILGEMLTISGSVNWDSQMSIAYAAQTPWLLNASLKDNILFGLPFNWRRYKKVINACALQPDILSLPAHDETEIGEKGINLSGGQKQRVSLARAIYSDADTVIMDDPFASLDFHVGKHVFEEAIIKRLIKRQRTVILVTHQVHLVAQANYIIVMKDGGIEHQGRISEIKKSDPELYDSWRRVQKEIGSHDSEPDGDKQIIKQNSASDLTRPSSQLNMSLSRPMSQMSAMTEKEEEEEADAIGDPANETSNLPISDKCPADEARGKLIQREHKESGAVGASMYATYIKAASIPVTVVFSLLLLSKHAATIGSDFWLSIWSSASTKYAHNIANLTSGDGWNGTIEPFDNAYYIPLFVGLSLSGIVLTFLTVISLQYLGIRAAKSLHRNMLHNLMLAPLRFFDTTPVGRILNRFSADVIVIDQKIYNSMHSTVRCMLMALAAIIVNTIITPYFLIAAAPLLIIYVLLQNFYRNTSRELQRIDSTTKSPIFAHFSETLNGLQTIRAYRCQKRFRRHAMNAIDTNNTAFLFLQTANRWLGIRLDYLGALLVFISAVASLSTAILGHTDPAFIGLCIAYALVTSNYLNWIVRNMTDLEMQMNAVERVTEYSNLTTEPQTHPEGNLIVAESWPDKGNIEFKNVSLRYDALLDRVVRDVSFSIQGGHKVGLCGRTGSGKTSLTMSLFRMIDISEGQIIIDDVDIARVPLQDLRSRIAIIPQDPLLFAGTIRFNMDPEGQHADDRIWAVLEKVQLKAVILEMADTLDTEVAEGGQNFSVGQRQLFCLARAFLKDTRILILDEATASIDLDTDEQIQRIISSMFGGKTVLTVAHRISTILSYDRVMVMDQGQIAEYAEPNSLLQTQGSLFSKLVKESKKATGS